jgi:hypothetical protein
MRVSLKQTIALLALAAGCAEPLHSIRPAPAVCAIALPDASADVNMDDIAYDQGSYWVWVPAGNTGEVDVESRGDSHRRCRRDRH